MPRLPNLEPIEPDPKPIVESGTARLKARGEAAPRRPYCDCGGRVFASFTQSAPGNFEIGPEVYCPKCDKYMRRVIAMDAETLVDIADPRPVEKQGTPPNFKAFRVERARIREMP